MNFKQEKKAIFIENSNFFKEFAFLVKNGEKVHKLSSFISFCFEVSSLNSWLFIRISIQNL